MLSPLDCDLEDESKLMAEWPSGPLDEYRRKASFDWRKMRLVLDGNEIVHFKQRVWKTFEDDPVFAKTPWQELTRDEERRITMRRLKRLAEYKFFDEKELLENPYLLPAFVQAVGQFSWSLMVKRILSFEYFIVQLKTNSHEESNKLTQDTADFKTLGAICITEMAHGSNTKDLMTTATYDPSSRDFILNTPCLNATKVWSGVLGQTATHAIVFAQLYTPDGQCHGLHSFLVPVRDPTTHTPYEGIMIGDMGPKLGLNGLDNGFMSFKNFRIPKSSLLNKSSRLTDDGKYISQVEKNKRFGITLGVLSTGRIFINLMSLTNLQTALCISVRYSALRKQFGPENSDEMSVIEYQTQQWRLLPFVAASYVLHNFFGSLYRDYVDFLVSVFLTTVEEQVNAASEIHSLSSCAKAVASWLARDAIQESRECCGGHGYLKASGFGELRDDHDANNTYEGDNNVLLQQTSNHLIKNLKEVRDGERIRSAFGSFNFLNNIDSTLNRKEETLLDSVEKVITAYEFLVCNLTQQSMTRVNDQQNNLKDQFLARSASQVYYLRTLSIAYFEFIALSRFQKFYKDEALPAEITAVLNKIAHLYGLWSIERHLTILYECQYFQLSLKEVGNSIRHQILELCSILRNDSVALVEAYAPPDHVLNSTLGQSNGRVYEHIFDALTHNKGAFDRCHEVKDLINHDLYNTGVTEFKSKL